MLTDFGTQTPSTILNVIKYEHVNSQYDHGLAMFPIPWRIVTTDARPSDAHIFYVNIMFPATLRRRRSFCLQNYDTIFDYVSLGLRRRQYRPRYREAVQGYRKRWTGFETAIT